MKTIARKSDPRKAHWEADENVPHCRLCLTSFTLTTRRHHCRACGQIFCGDCSRYYLLLPEEMGYSEPRRTCRTCLHRHSTLNYAQTCTCHLHHSLYPRIVPYVRCSTFFLLILPSPIGELVRFELAPIFLELVEV